jgi:hypothetical protein
VSAKVDWGFVGYLFKFQELSPQPGVNWRCVSQCDWIALSRDVAKDKLKEILKDPWIAKGLSHRHSFQFGETIEPSHPNSGKRLISGITNDVSSLKIVAVERLPRGDTLLFHVHDRTDAQGIQHLFLGLHNLETNRVVTAFVDRFGFHDALQHIYVLTVASWVRGSDAASRTHSQPLFKNETQDFSVKKDRIVDVVIETACARALRDGLGRWNDVRALLSEEINALTPEEKTAISECLQLMVSRSDDQKHSGIFH